jgi:hypothetical protein
MRVALMEELSRIDRVELGERPDPAPVSDRCWSRSTARESARGTSGFSAVAFQGLPCHSSRARKSPASSKRPATEPTSIRASGCMRACSRRVAGSPNWRWHRRTAWPHAQPGELRPGRLQPGETVLITAAVQIAAALGARPLGVASPPNHDYLRSLGASVVFDYTPPPGSSRCVPRFPAASGCC